LNGGESAGNPHIYWWDVFECLGAFITSRFSKQANVMEMDILATQQYETQLRGHVLLEAVEKGSPTGQNRLLYCLLYDAARV
jgi:hypothetical protein